MARKFFAHIELQGQAETRWFEAPANGTNYVSFKAPAALAGDVVWTLPAADGTLGQALITNGSGTLSWVTLYTSSDFDVDFGNKSTSDLAEGTNLYFTDARAVDAVEAVGTVTLDAANDHVIVLDATDGTLKKVAAIELAGVTKASFTISDADTFPLALSHNLGTKDVVVQVYDAANDETIELDSVVRTDVNTVTVNPVGQPATFSWRVVVLG